MTRSLSSELMDLSQAEDSLVAPELAAMLLLASPGSSLLGSPLLLSPAKDALARLSGRPTTEVSRAPTSQHSTHYRRGSLKLNRASKKSSSNSMCLLKFNRVSDWVSTGLLKMQWGSIYWV